MKTLWMRVLLLASALAWVGPGASHADGGAAKSAAALGTKYGSLHDLLGHNQFQRPLYMESSEAFGAVTGDIYALINHPFVTVGAALNGPARWCDIMMLHINTKYCGVSTDSHGSVLDVTIGKKHYQSLDDGYRLHFAYRVVAATPDYLKVMLTADDGPLGTRDYRIMLEAVPVDGGRTFIHFTYSYAYGLAGRLAMQAYLGTIGSGKVGFTVVGVRSDGRHLLIGGMRGLAERNTMRYYLAIEAFLGALSVPPQMRQEKSMRDWYSSIERYPRQLLDLERSEYLDLKRKEYLRQQAGPRATRG